VTNHYLCLVKAAPSKTLPLCHQLKYPVIADSGANFYMFKEKESFESLVPAIGSVILGDGTTRLPIHGVGTVKCFIGDQLLILDNVRYVPSLSDSIYSLFLLKQPNHGLESSFERGLFLIFPKFKTQAIIGHNNIYLDATPYPLSTANSFTDTSLSLLDTSMTVCRHIKQFQEVLEKESHSIDSLLQHLQK
jgi:hypothetical protein